MTRQLLPGTPFLLHKYDDYDQYLTHQASKFNWLQHADYLNTATQEYRKRLRKILKELSLIKKGVSVLCLGSRAGGEVMAFRDLGCKAIGIDLNPEPSSKTVIYGDFHNLAWDDNSLNIVFTNSIDHSIQPDRLTSEVLRVLMPGGLFITQILPGSQEGYTFGHFEAMAWPYTQDVVDYITNRGFTVIARRKVGGQLPGELIAFRSRE